MGLRQVPPAWTSRIVKTTRGRLSTSGNPTHVVHFENGTIYRIEPDASANYDCQNPEFQFPNYVRVWLSDRALITVIEEGDEADADEPAPEG